MKKLIFAALAAFALVSVEAREFTVDEVMKLKKEDLQKMKPEDRRQARHVYMTEMKKQRSKRIAEEGGEVQVADPKSKDVVFLIVDEAVPRPVVDNAAAAVSRLLGVPCNVKAAESSGRTPCEIAGAEYAKGIAGAVIAFVGNDKTPTLLSAPEDCWSIVNAKKIAADNPSAEVFSDRIEKETWRAIVLAMGGINSQQQPCIMRTIRKPVHLDAYPVKVPSPEPFGHLMNSLREYGMRPYLRGTYLEACKKGWAPAPTNDLQKAIWDKAHEVPTKPIKVEFDPKKGE